jgi:4-amino-4-deoxy-L-arabinose transferase-like glycosyltransferase
MAVCDAADGADTSHPADSTRQACLLIGGFLLVRLAIAAILPAMVDEAYGIVVSRAWSLSYFDHPPVCFTTARLMAWLTGSEQIFLMRLPFILAGALSSWLVYDITRLAYGTTAGLWALAWYSIAPFFLLSAGQFVVPDGPLDLFLLATLRLVLPDLLASGRPLHAGRWLAGGLCFACALAAKYQAVLFGASALGFLVASPEHRRLLRSPVVWLTLAVALLGLVPTLAWNAAHGWISLGFQAGRAGTRSMALQPLNFLTMLGGQLLYLLPVTWLVMIITAGRSCFRPRTPADRLFAWFTLLPPAVFLALALVSQRSLPHWAMSGYLFGFPLVGDWTARRLPQWGEVMRVVWRATAGAVVLSLLAFSLQARAALVTRPLAGVAPVADLNWQFQEWPALAKAWPRLGDAPAVVVANWVVGGKAGHALGPGVRVVPLSDPRHFQFLEAARADSRAPAVAVQPVAAGRAEAEVPAFLAMLEAGGFRIAGPPEIIGERAGDHLRFEIIAVPLHHEGDRH